jgi:hypothetical protein
MPWPNGVYQVVSKNAPYYSFRLRVDLNPASGLDSYLSLDLYQGLMAAGADPDLAAAPGLLFLGSFRSKKLEPQASPPAELQANLYQTPDGPDITHLYQGSDGPGVIHLTLLPDADPARPTHRILCFGSGIEPGFPADEFECDAEWLAATFHTLALTIDASPGFPRPYAIPADAGAGRPTFVECFRRAGFQVVGGAAMDGELQDQAAWTVDGLRGRAHVRTAAAPPGWSLDVYLMIATTMADSSGTTGIMFDKPRRAAAAVFLQALVDLYSQGQGDFELYCNYLFTAVHEVAHCLNMPHVFERRPLPGLSYSSLTFMNYPQDYDGGGNLGAPDAVRFPGVARWDPAQALRYRSFWSQFRYAFDPEELLELRHGARRDLATGDNVTAYWGAFAGDAVNMALGGSAGAFLELTLRFRGPDRPGVAPAAVRVRSRDRGERPCAIFEFGEPIHIEAELRSFLTRPRTLTRRLSPATGDLQIAYQTPDNRFLTYRPPCALCYVPEPKIINGQNHREQEQPDSWHKDICLNVGGGAFRFLTPGRYRVRASYRYHDTLLVSNILELYVRRPTPEVEDLVVPLLDEDVAAYLAYRGVAELARARDRLREAFLDGDKPRRDAAHPLRDHFFACEALIHARAAASNDSLGKEERRCLARALGIDRLKDLEGRRKKPRADLAALPFSNIALTKIGRRIRDTLANKPEEARHAAALDARLREALEARGVPEAVRDYYLRKKAPDGPRGAERL